MDNDNGDYLAPTNSELLALNNTNKPSIFGLVSQLAKNVEKKHARKIPGGYKSYKLDQTGFHFRCRAFQAASKHQLHRWRGFWAWKKNSFM